MVICVTGPMAAGKNFVSSLIEKQVVNGKPFVSIDADVVGHRAVENSTARIIENFGELARQKGIQLVDEKGNIIRRNLGALIFGNNELVARQEAIVYPEITSLINSFIEENKYKNVIVNATVLYKVPVIKRMDAIIYVDCPWFVRLIRAKKRDEMKFSLILARFKSQKGLYSAYRATGVKIFRIFNFCTKKCLQKKIINLFTNC
ncbi:dephospho-CoA kinase [Treponema sp.]|uniref:dephospho-CoA kinase n=1 Tax=Treponema sp. TaxID=166 RepID=UPI002A7EC309|nr:dephospho-CoA kinase [Treponema sp.]MCI6442515.1 dephospho-CoA kinase [Spirochaetia bacterium]MDY4132111.1 dephospho-CoA kinase [Treponema sp.]